jgi:hypothetical protein
MLISVVPMGLGIQIADFPGLKSWAEVWPSLTGLHSKHKFLLSNALKHDFGGALNRDATAQSQRDCSTAARLNSQASDCRRLPEVRSRKNFPTPEGLNKK